MNFCKSDSVFIDQEHVTMDETILCHAMGSVYIWKLQKKNEEYPEDGKAALRGIIKNFLIGFFKVESGDTDDVANLTLDFLDTLKKFFRNIKVKEVELLDFVLESFFHFHNEVIDLKREKSLEIISTVKQSLALQETVKRFLLKDLSLEYQSNVFLTKIIQMKGFSETELIETFLSSFRPFIKDYSNQTEKLIVDYINNNFDSYTQKFNNTLSNIKSKIENFLFQIIESISCVRVTLLMKEVCQNETLSPWIVCFESYFDNENIELKQVVSISPTSVLINLGFHDSDSILAVFSSSHLITISHNMIEDSSTIVCEGSAKESLIFLHNKLKKAYIAIEKDGKIEAKQELDIYSNQVGIIKSAIILRLSKEIVYVDENGSISYFQLNKRNHDELNKSQIVPTLYRSVHLSACGNFVLLQGKTESYVLTNRLELIMQDEVLPDLACLTRNMLFCIKVNENQSFEIIKSDINSDYVSNIDVTTSLTDKVDYGVRTTYSFGRELIKGMLEKKRFENFHPHEFYPK